MALNLFECFNIRPAEDEYAVDTLRKQLQNDEELQNLQEQSTMLRLQQDIIAQNEEYMAEIAKQIEEETDVKNLLQLKKLQNHLHQTTDKDKAQIAAKTAVLEQKRKATEPKLQQNRFAQYWLEQEPYAEAFAQAYRIKDEAFKRGDNAKIDFVSYSEPLDPHRLKPQGQFYKEVMNDGKPLDYFALHVDLGNNLPFNIVMEPSDRNEARTQMRIVLAPQDVETLDFDNPAVDADNRAKIRQIIEFCERYGFSTFDMHIPMTFDGHVDENAYYESVRDKIDLKEREVQERLKQAFMQVQEEIKAEQIENWQKEAAENDAKEREIKEYAAAHPEENINWRDYSLANEPQEYFSAQRSELSMSADANASASMNSSAQAGTSSVPIITNSPKKCTMEELETTMEEMLGKGLNKTRNSTYFRRKLFNSNWVEYTIYDKPGKRDDDGRRDKNDIAQYTYAYKLFVSVDENGMMTFSYRRNGGAKIDDLVNALAGKFQDLGITHINFPAGLPDDEKGLWRKALAEKGIVYKGMSIDVDKAEGMIKAAKDKHMPTDKLIEFKYRIALQMQENNAKKGKTPVDDEADYISGLVNTYRYRGFTNGYARGLKSLINKTLIAGDPNYGAINKIAAYRAFRQVFDVYQEVLRIGSIANLREGTIEKIINSANPQEEREQVFVTQEQKQKLLGLGISNIQEISAEQLKEMYKILLDEQSKAAEKEIYAVLDNNRLKDIRVIGAKMPLATLVRNIFNEAKKSVDAINSDNLVAMGVDEIGLPKDGQVSLGIGAYIQKVEAEEAARRAAEAKSETKTPAPNHSIRQDTSRGM